MTQIKNITHNTINKKSVTIRLDEDVVEWFKDNSSMYQTRMNAVLRAYMNHYKE